MVVCASACRPITKMVYWLPLATPDPIVPVYVSVTDWPAANWNPPKLEKFPGNVLEKFPDLEKVRVKDVELKGWDVKLNCAAVTGLRVLLLCTRNLIAPAMQAGSENCVRVCEVVVVVAVGHPLPCMTCNELMDTACDPTFWIVSDRAVPESVAPLISIFPLVVETLGG